jgi:hypothetical protein
MIRVSLSMLPDVTSYRRFISAILRRHVSPGSEGVASTDLLFTSLHAALIWGANDLKRGFLTLLASFSHSFCLIYALLLPIWSLVESKISHEIRKLQWKENGAGIQFRIPRRYWWPTRTRLNPFVNSTRDHEFYIVKPQISPSYLENGDQFDPFDEICWRSLKPISLISHLKLNRPKNCSKSED